MEDLNYNRFSKGLSSKLSTAYTNNQNNFIWDTSWVFWTWFDMTDYQSGFQITWVPDIQTRYIVKNSVKRLIEIFNWSTLGEMRKDVYNAWRYNSGWTVVWVDLIPYLASNVDLLSETVVRNVNNDLESKIDDLVKNWLSRDIAIPTTFTKASWDVYKNFLYWTDASTITNAESCTIYRWSLNNSWTLVEAHRWFDVNVSQPDAALCNTAQTLWYWWGYSPLNLDVSWVQSWSIWKLKFQDPTNATKPLYDIKWAFKSTDTTKIPTPEACLDNNLLLTLKTVTSWDSTYTTNPINCYSHNEKLEFDHDFNYAYNNFPLWASSCENAYLTLSWTTLKSYTNNDCGWWGGWWDWWGDGGGATPPQTPTTTSYNYKKITSYITHKSPTSGDLREQVKYMASPNLPIDKDRYVDFIAANNTYAKINYPYLFRIWAGAKSIEETKTILKNYLDSKSLEINNLINSKDPSSLSADEKAIYDLLKTWDYPSGNINLYDYLNAKPVKQLEVLWDEKDISYLDTLVFSIYWNNLNSVSAKYKFIFENYLSDQFGSNDANYYLPKNKKQYEISYLWAPWDSKNMYVKLDPEEMGENPYADIMASNQNLSNTLLFSNTDANDDSSMFKCAPPEWVPIWKWIPAVMCRLKTILPPTISISDWKCWVSMLWSGDDDSSDYEDYYPSDDVDKNWINDYLEDEIRAWSLVLKTDNKKYYYNTSWTLKANILDSSWKVINYDDTSKINFELIKVETPSDKWVAKKVIFDKYWLSWKVINNSWALNEAKKYVNFTDYSIRVSNWSATYNFSTKSLDADLTFKVTLNLIDRFGNTVVKKEDLSDIFVRGNLFYSNTYKLDEYQWMDTLDLGINSVSASSANNLFIVSDDSFKNLKWDLNNLNSYSSSPNKLFISLSNKDKEGKEYNLSYPIKVNIYDEDEKLLSTKTFNNLSQVNSLWSFKKAWTYNVEIIDNLENKITKEIEILPWLPKEFKVNLWSNLVEKGWVTTTNFFYVNDEFWNPTAWSLYEVEVSLNWDWVTFEDWATTKKFNIFEWYELFKLKSTNNSWNTSINFKVLVNWKPSLIDFKSIQTVDKIDFDVTWLPNNIKVWWNKYNFQIALKNTPTNTNFSSRAYLMSNSVYIKPLDSFVSIEQNIWTWSFETTKKAWEKVNLEFKIEWVKDSFYKEINILPDTALRLDLSLSKSKIEASTWSTSDAYVEIKDRYDNVVWNDNSTILKLEIPAKYSHIINSSSLQKNVSKWKASFLLKATDIPWIAYFKVSSSPSLSSNSIEIEWQSPFLKTSLDSISWMRNVNWSLTSLGWKFFSEYDFTNYRFKYNSIGALQESEDFKNLPQTIKDSLTNLFNANNKVVIKWVWENAWRIDTYYFWNKEKIDGNKYNSIYTTLLWSSYWDITIKDNLANSIIFDKNNRWLAVTSLLNDIVKYSDIINVNPNGNISLNKNNTDLSNDVSTNFSMSKEWNLEISFFNETFSKLVSSVYMSFKKDNLSLNACTDADINKCFKDSKDNIVLKPLNSGYTGSLVNWQLTFSESNGSSLLSVSENGKITKSPYVDFEINSSYKDFLALNIKVDSKVIWVLWLKFYNPQFNIIRDINALSNIQNWTKSSIVSYLEWRDYFYRSNYLWNSTKWEVWYTIYYKDPFDTNSNKLDKFSTNFEFWYEWFDDNGWIGWNASNKTLLSFSAWKNVWDATKDYMTFSLINIWDPVVSLKPIKKKLPWSSADRSFDSTIWKLISNDSNNISYSVFDYNKDSIKDTAILKRNWYIELLQGTSDINNFINKGNIAYISDFSTKWVIETWDFTWDGYEDIFILNKEWKPILLNNNKKDFVRIDLDKQFNLSWRIMQAISYDMDKDSVSDLVIYDDSWTINIFYWSNWNYDNPKFTKKLIDNWLGLKLNSSVRNDWGLIYFDGLYQIPEDASSDYLQNSEDFQQTIANNIEKVQNQWSSTDDEFNEWVVDSLIFTKLSYSPYNSIPKNPKDEILSNLPDIVWWEWADISDINEWINDAKSSITEMIEDSWFLDTYNSWSNSYDYSNSNDVTTFIRSDYAETQWLKVEKKYLDVNSWILKSNDKIELQITLENTTNHYVDDISLVENIPDPFSYDVNNASTLEIDNKIINWSWILFQEAPDSWYSFLLDSYKYNSTTHSLWLYPWEQLKLTLSLDTIPFDYWYIEAWLFEEWEPGDDIYWDVIFKLNKKICWETSWIYRSTSTREYEKWTKPAVCEKWTLNDLDNKNADVDWNNIPDYIDKIIDSSKTNWTDFQNFNKDSLNDLLKDTDNDWIPDQEDRSPWFSSDDDFMSWLDSINEKVDEISSAIDSVLDWLSCWFGGWWCIASPLNWAPLAPWNDPTLFWFPIWDWLQVAEWIPLFAAPTIWIPPIWPPSPIWAWGRLDMDEVWEWISEIRLFITPTITWAIWTAICFWPNVASRWESPPWLHPVVNPFWNCIVAAMPLFWCKNDWSDWEIYNVWVSSSNIYNWNCSNSTSKEPSSKTYFSDDLVKDYINYKKTWTRSPSFTDNMKESLWKVAHGTPSTFSFNWPLINAFDWADSMWEISVSLDLDALKSFNFQDAVKLKMTRIMPFPDFLMDWVTRQIEEIVNKLTDFPTLYVILPDFSWIFDTFDNFIPNLKKAWSDWSKKWENVEKSIDGEINFLNQEKASLNCDDNPIRCWSIDVETAKLELERDSSINQKASWIKAVYKFLSNLPLIAINPEKVHINVPNIDMNTINRAIADFELTKKQWMDEIKRAGDSWTLWKTCSWDQEEVASCKSENEIWAKIVLDASNLVNSIDKNIEILNEYKRFPEKLNKLIRFKEIRLEQILCNIDNISYILGWRIWDNWKRFKAWVELYVLIKAILKSWQLLIDIFVDYAAWCHQCKNERNDLMYYIWKLISMIIPKIPVIQFPKWPDIYIDLHNIRAWLNIWIPEFEFNLRPILLPTLPNLYLPTLPTVVLNLPSIPLLPLIEIPDLPLLPSLPEVKLPDLPPPPKLPKIFWALSAILNILKLITKIMCIIKKSPFVPEWRAWDLIAFITERQWFLPFDFLDISMPQFSLPFVDAIKVTTWVNLEFEADFLTEAARQSVMPVNVFTNDIVNMLNIDLWDFDFRWIIPSEINVDIWKDWIKTDLDWGKIIDTDVIKDNIDNVKWGIDDIKNSFNDTSFKVNKNWKISLLDLAMILSSNIWRAYSYMSKESSKTVTNEEFKKIVWDEISNPMFYENANTSKIPAVWNETFKYSFSKEDKLIQELLKNNENKFNTLKDVINEEINKNKELQKNLDKVLKPKDYITIDSKFWSNVTDYNNRFTDYNLKTIQSALEIWNEDTEVSEIKTMWNDVKWRVYKWLDSFSSDLAKGSVNVENSINTAKNLVALKSTPTTSNKISWPLAYKDNTLALADADAWDTSVPSGTCKVWWENSYVYKWLYYVERYLGKKISYRLFDYLDEVDWNERYYEKDFDNDWDDDAIYMVSNEIYIKESLKNKKTKTFYNWSPIVLAKSNNDYYNNSKVYYESVNNFKEWVSDSNYINFSFMQPKNSLLSNFRIEFYQIVDKFVNLENNNYIPENIKNHIIDAFRDIDTITQKEDNSSYTLSNNLAYIKNIWNLSQVSLYTKSLKDLQDDIKNKNEVVINAGTKLYTWPNNVKLVYYNYSDKDKDLKYKDITIDPYSNIEFKQDIVISSMNSPLYVEWKEFVTLTWNEIAKYIKKPLLPWTKIEYLWSDINAWSSYIWIEYYDGSSADLDFSKVKYYELYDLWNISDSYLVRTNMENDYYYAKIRSFNNWIFGTYSNQVLLSPQLASDTKAPEISWLTSIKLPVYQKMNFDMTDKIFENGSIKNIDDIYIDFDITKDTSLDGDTTNDRDYYLNKPKSDFNITIKNSKINFEVWSFDSLMNKKIRIYVVDKNGNIGYKDIDFIVYSPIPAIKSVNDNWIISWLISEDLKNEPVSLYRYRAWNLTRLKDLEWNFNSQTIDTWKFDFKSDKNWSWLVLNSSSTWWITNLAKINENTGKIDNWINSNLNVRVYSSNHPNNNLTYPKIILSKDGQDVYYEYLAIPNAWEVKDVTDFSNIKEVWTYFKMTDNSTYNYFKNPSGVTDAWELFIYSKTDEKNTPIVSIFKDWRIDTSNNFSLEYTTFWEYVVYKILDNTGKEVARVMLIPEWNYVMK
jgi:hypothetical protein